MVFEEIKIKKALNKLHSNFLPYKYDLNIYRGCSHRCQYCYALYSHRYLENKNFFEKIYIKTNIVEVLEKELSSKRWHQEWINLGGVTDSYQAIERQYQIMPKILELMIKYKNPITISTKSDLILRDMDLLEKLAKVTTVNVAVTITTWNERLAQKLEPGAISSQKRMEIFRQLKNKGINLGLHLMPIVPYLNSDEKNLENILKEAEKIKVDYVIAGMLNLRSETRKNFLKFIQENFPQLSDKYFREYKGAYWEKEKRQEVYFLVHRLMKKYGLNGNYEKFRPKEIIQQQLSLI
ncbi:hypothetical protein SDC9_114117 [bioreactor metagenome]|uniref:Radical SAM core domain-containing protein n=1 Tax=bioreactor metagenome TaxID=1076179 RepID=A0A645BNY9_9ZZZZ